MTRRASMDGGWPGATREFAHFVATTRYDDLPASVVEAVKWVVLDTIAVMVAGATAPAPRALARVLDELSGDSVATVPGLPRRYDPASAALLNGTTGHALDYDDYCFAMSGHPSVVLLPPILALAERDRLSGRDMICAYAVGFEAAIMLSYTVNPDHYGHGWHGTGTIGAIGGACAAANLLGLSEDQTMRAISAAASAAAGLRQNFGTDVKPYHAGNAARSAIMSAELARAGFTANEAILEGRFGFFHTFNPDPGRRRAKPDIEFGDPWKTLRPGITTKLFPACGSTHTSIGAILGMRDAGLAAKDVEQIEVAVTAIAGDNLPYSNPQTGLEGKFSMQYCLARALTSGAPTIDDFTDDAVRDPAVTPLYAKIQLRIDSELEAGYVWGQHRPAVVTVRTASGDTVVHRADAPPGSPGNFSKEMLRHKVDDCLRRGTVTGSPDQIVERVTALEDCADVRELTALLSAG